MTTIHVLPPEIITHIAAQMNVFGRAMARCAWAGFAAVIQQGTNVIDDAAKQGDIESIIAVQRCPRSGTPSPTSRTMYKAAKHGQIECMRWLHNNDCPIDARNYDAVIRRGVFLGAAEYINLVQRLHPLDHADLYNSAVEHGRADIFTYLDHHIAGVDCVMISENAIAGCLSSEILDRLLVGRCNDDLNRMLALAIDRRNTMFIDRLCATGMQINKAALWAAMSAEWFDMMYLLYDRGAPLCQWHFRKALRTKNVSILEWIVDRLDVGRAACAEAVTFGDLDMVMLMCRWGHEITMTTLYCAMYLRQNDIIEYIYYTFRGRADITAAMYKAAVRTDNIAAVAWLRSLSEPPPPGLCTIAAQWHCHMLPDLRDLGCAWDNDTLITIARVGDHEYLRYAYEDGAPGSRKSCAEAIVDVIEHLPIVPQKYTKCLAWIVTKMIRRKK